MVSYEVLDGSLLKSMIKNGTINLKNNQDYVNELNVFPVPDGDTGLNMRMTIEGGYSAILESTDNVSNMAKSLARSMVLSARGNSGVILSQFFKGFFLGVENREVVDVVELAEAFVSGYKQAYNVVKHPVEGTMLTVIREASEYAKKKVNRKSTIKEFFDLFLEEARASLARTPDLLPVLKEAGVVDSGGVGVIKIFEGMQAFLSGKEVVDGEASTIVEKANVNHSFNADSVLEYGYCTEFILQLQNAKVKPAEFDIAIIENFLSTIGDSIVAFKDDDIVKVHVHTMMPGKVINYCQQFGEYISFKMENMSVQHNEVVAKRKHLKHAVVAVAPSVGMADSFSSIGADAIVFGGQTMNPSTEDFIKAFEKLDAENIYVFPNNSNVIMTAKQAASNYTKTNVVVLPTNSIGQCHSALTMLDYSSNDVNIITEEFQMAIENVSTVEFTHAIRDSEFNGIRMKKGDFIGIYNDKIVAANADRLETVSQTLSNIEDLDEKEVMTLFYGKDVDVSLREAIQSLLEMEYARFEIGEVNGDQDVYFLIISLE